MDWVKLVMGSVDKLLNGSKGRKVYRPKTDNQQSPFEEAKQIVDEIIQAEEEEPVCSPDTCKGECQGMGECKMATGFRNAIVPKIINKPHPLECKCKICNAKLQLGK